MNARGRLPLAVPRMATNKAHIGLTFYADLTAFMSAPTDTAYNRLARIIAVVSTSMRLQGIDQYDIQLRSAKLVMAAVFARFERSGKVTVLDLEQTTLRTAAPAIEEAIGRTRLDAFIVAHALAKAEMEAQGAPVEA